MGLFLCSPCSTIDKIQHNCLWMNPGSRSQNTSPLNTMLFSAQLGFLLPRTRTSLAQSCSFLVAWAQPPGLAPLHLILQTNSTPDISSTQAPEEEAVQSNPPHSHSGQTLTNLHIHLKQTFTLKFSFGHTCLSSFDKSLSTT